MKKIIPFLLIIFYIIGESSAQNLKGHIKGFVHSQEKGIPFANIGLLNSPHGVSSDEKGLFEIKNIPIGEYEIQVSVLGYETIKQRIEVKGNNTTQLKLELEETFSELDEVVVSATLKEISRKKSPVPVEVFTPSYFRKNPTPALFEALQIVNGVRPQLNCNVCNTGDIHINGMEGPYTMILIDGMPMVGGLASVYGLNGIPNSIVERMEVVKGPASTLYGSEAVGGLINVITKNPKKAPLFSLDIYGTDWREINTDLAMKQRIGKASTLLGVNYFNYGNAIDRNGDNFTDITLQDRISLFNKWSFERKKNRVATLAGRFIYEDRWGGEMQWTPEYRGGNEIYGESIYTSRYELMGAYELPLQEEFLFSFSYSNHHQDARYGYIPYIAQENILFNQLTWNKKIKEKHDLLIGAALRYTVYDDNTDATGDVENLALNKASKSWLPGVFIQDQWTINPSHTLLMGIRQDYHSKHGNIFSPRLNHKWAINPSNIIRFSIGNGFRVVNLFTEEHAANTGARELVIKEELKPERSYNANINYQKFIGTDFGLISLDATAFYTYFTNKISADYETNDQQIIYDNLNGHAVSQGFSLNTDVDFSVLPLEVTLGLSIMDVYQVEDINEVETKSQQLLTEKYSATFAISYSFEKINLSIDYTGNLYGPMKLPILENDLRAPNSPLFSIQNIQLTKEFSDKWSIYGGIKNLLNFTPPANSILSSFAPFEEEFDPTYVYASNQGIRSFLGIRFNVLED